MIEKISLITGVSIPDIFSKSRKSEIVEARQLYCYLIRKHLSLHKIGKIININHATVVHSVNVINKLIEVNDKRTMYLLEEISKLPKDFYKQTKQDLVSNQF